MSLVTTIARGTAPQASASVTRDVFTLDEFGELLATLDLGAYVQQTLVGNRVTIAGDFLGHVRQAYKANPIVFSCIDNRRALFSQGRFKYRRFRDGKPGDFFGDPSLALLEEPWVGGTTAKMLALSEVDVSAAGNSLWARRFSPSAGREVLKRLRPDWTAVVHGTQETTDDPDDVHRLDAGLLGYLYLEGGPGSSRPAVVLLPEEVAHYMPIPDPEAPWRGMSWLTPVLREIAADQQMTEHRQKYLEGGATPNLAVKINVQDAEAFLKHVEAYAAAREGRGRGKNPYKTLFLNGLMDATPLGANLEQIDFAKVQGAGEVRIATAAGVHPTILAINEGLQGASLNAGNFGEAWRQFADQTTRPLWSDFASAVSKFVDVPADAELAVYDRDIPALQEDVKKIAEAQREKSTTINTLWMAGFEADSIVRAVEANDFTLLKHSGAKSVQQQPGAANGNGNGRVEELVP